MQKVSVPTFNKRNQHFVPQFWQRNFVDDSNQLQGIYREGSDPKRSPKRKGVPRAVSPADTMTQDWTYTVFTPEWMPSDELENALAEVEGHIKNVMDQILDPAVTFTSKLRGQFCWALALAACRLPHVMARGHRRAKELAWKLCEVATMDRGEFITMLWSEYAFHLSPFGYEELSKRSHETLVATAERIGGLSPQDWMLPQVEGLLAVDPICEIIETLDISLLELDSPPFFVLGDTPLPDSDLAVGFAVPLTRKVAIKATPAIGASPNFTRRKATPQEVDEINRWQAENFLHVMIGPSATQLRELVRRSGGESGN